MRVLCDCAVRVLCDFSVTAQGHTAVKIKLGKPTVKEDISRVAAVREEIGPDISLMVDANMGWTVAVAVAAAKELAKCVFFLFFFVFDFGRSKTGFGARARSGYGMGGAWRCMLVAYGGWWC